MKVTLFSGPDCNKSDLAKRQLDKRGITHEEVSLAEHPALVAKFKAEGCTALEIVRRREARDMVRLPLCTIQRADREDISP